MARSKKADVQDTELMSWFEESKPKLCRLSIRNFRSIGEQPVVVDLDDIVVLVGPNNAGKSSILRAYELVMLHGSKGCVLSESDFPFGKVNEDALPEIELHTAVHGDTTPGQRWVQRDSETGLMVVRERWIWPLPNKEPKRQGFDVEKNEWDDQVPWGAPNVAQSKRPEPHRVEAFSNPQEQEKKIADLLLTILKDRVAGIQGQGETDGLAENFAILLRLINETRQQIIEDTKPAMEAMESDLTQAISEVFPGYVVKFNAHQDENPDSDISLFKTPPKLLMGPSTGYQSTIDRQGSGARRTLLWAALRLLVQSGIRRGTAVSTRPHVLLLDEPELCLHPSAIREACRVLYDLPQLGNWQVMVTTHSPAFVDVSRNNTTIVRVERNDDGTVQGTTIFRPDKAQLDDNDRERLKLLNIYDPYVAEFFFGGHSIIVEGDTEYTAFKQVIAKNPSEFRNVHIIRARGKATIVSLCKILNHFGAGYSVLHDSDTPTVWNGKLKKYVRSGPWTLNQSIMDVTQSAPHPDRIRLLASIHTFEIAYFGEMVGSEKPYNALAEVSNNPEAAQRISDLVRALIYHDAPVPSGCIEWTSLDQLAAALETVYEAATGEETTD